MDNFIMTLVENSPTYAGLAILAWVLWRQNERMLSALLERVSILESKVTALTVKLDVEKQDPERWVDV
jgi:hypothetical protein